MKLDGRNAPEDHSCEVSQQGQNVGLCELLMQRL